ncbi:helix-turn-helix transcriptional regulator [Chitinophaga arvensicola]|uniref:Predicted DNA-binding transcriptional regulator YafY, contains an HTH and WYL domains n=1 Tax=Chitinophaga arvensicola TaxID=29529 RepID=A0A1I0SDC3_9BACT|nr:YafY family protein [Chitinophaga arvensicola]SEW53958.1 Predicted DNA-binding transcriptional regulator YafY, contains an HTH and WYL domains [Chitinophaga arvensicola]
MNRFDRLTAILIHLQSKKLVLAQEIADRFDVSLRTVYRDVRSLEQAGVPVIGEKGLGYSIMEGYRLPPVMFTEEEVIAFLMAEKILENHADLQNSERFKGAMFKVKAVLRNAQKKVLEEMEENIAVKHKVSEHNHLLNDTLPLVIKAIGEKNTLHIQYATDKGVNERDIEPIGIFQENGTWNAIAFCRTSKKYHPFRTERMLSVKDTGKPFQQTHISLSEYLADRPKDNGQSFPVVINVHNNMARYLTEQKYNYGFEQEEAGPTHTRMTFEAPCIQAFSRWYITFADQADIITPVSLKTLVKSRLQEMLEKVS